VGRGGVSGLGLAVFEPRHATFAEVRFETERAEASGSGWGYTLRDWQFLAAGAGSGVATASDDSLTQTDRSGWDLNMGTGC